MKPLLGKNDPPIPWPPKLLQRQLPGADAWVMPSIIRISTSSHLFKSTVFWTLEIEGVGLTAILTTIGIPFDIPPNIPPD